MSSEESINVPISAQSATVQTEAGTATWLMRVYYSSYHLWAAEHFTQLAADVENSPGVRPRFDIQYRAYVTSAILSSVAFLEGAINELFKDVADEHESYIAPIDEDSRKLILAMWDLTEERNRSPFSTLDKYQIVLTFCRKEQFSTGTQPYQDADLVIRLRNKLMHYKPESSDGEVQQKLDKQLARKFSEKSISENLLMTGSGNPFFPDRCLGSACAAWAVRSTKKLADDFFQKLGITPHYQQVRF